MDATVRRWRVPVLAALAVLVVIVAAVAWSQRPDGEDAGFGAAPPGASDGGGVPGDPGSGAPADPGGSDLPDGGLTPAPGPDVPPAPDTQAIEGYFPRDARTLALNYATGVPECYGKVGQPVVVESAEAVTVTLPKIPPKHNRDVACIDIALMRSVDVTLATPLGDRVVRDGSREDARVPRADAPYGDGDGEPAY